jgi:hypothetical protein
MRYLFGRIFTREHKRCICLFVPTIHHHIGTRGHLKRNRNCPNKFRMVEFMPCFPLLILLVSWALTVREMNLYFQQLWFKFACTFNDMGSWTKIVRIFSTFLF